MNHKQLPTKTFRTAAFAAALFFGTSAVFAQVKIGTNPTTIDPANNLEVEASTAGRKTLINKTTGQVTIADGTQGVGKILTSDANGGASWESGTSAFSAVLTTAQAIAAPPGVDNIFYVINFGSMSFDQDNSFNLSTDRFTVTKPGTYFLSGNVVINPSSGPGGSVAIYKNGIFQINSGGPYAAGSSNPYSISLIDIALPGDYYELRVNTNAGTANVSRSYFSGTRMR